VKDKIPLFKIYWDEEDIKNVTHVIKSGSSWADGSEISRFEENVSEYIGTEYAIAFNSGTSALHSLLLAYDIKQGDEIIVPSFTFISTPNTPLFLNAKPVFADIEEKTWGLDPEDVKEKITSKTKAIIPIHYGGCPCLIEELKEIAEDYRIPLFEDAAESFGAKVGDKKIGTFGEASMMSFCQNKVITTGEGGAILTDSKELFNRLKLIRSHGRLETQDYFASSEIMEYVTLGYNFRMSTMTAALGISQIKKVDQIIEMRRNKAAYMSKKLSKIEGVNVPEIPKNYHHVHQLYSIKVSENIRDNLIKYLSEKGISSKIYFMPAHLTYFYRNTFGYKKGLLPVTEKISNQVLSLPIYPTLEEAKIDYIAKEISNYLGEKE
jgi:perosamine synthetase